MMFYIMESDLCQYNQTEVIKYEIKRRISERIKLTGPKKVISDLKFITRTMVFYFFFSTRLHSLLPFHWFHCSHWLYLHEPWYSTNNWKISPIRMKTPYSEQTGLTGGNFHLESNWWCNPQVILPMETLTDSASLKHSYYWPPNFLFLVAKYSPSCFFLVPITFPVFCCPRPLYCRLVQYYLFFLNMADFLWNIEHIFCVLIQIQSFLVLQKCTNHCVQFYLHYRVIDFIDTDSYIYII